MSNLLSFGSSSKTSPALTPFVGRPLADAQSCIFSLKQTGTTVRVIPAGSAVTMDYRTDRVNVVLDKNGNISRTYQG